MSQNVSAIEGQRIATPSSARSRLATTEDRGSVPADRSPQSTADSQANPAGSSLLLSSLQRLYDANDAETRDPQAVVRVPGTDDDDPEYRLSASLLEAVFEISDFDPLPQLSQHEDFGLLPRFEPRRPGVNPVGRATGPRARTESIETATPKPATVSGSDRRRLPRRESECLIAVYLCTTNDHLTADRIAWLLHGTQLKGTLVDVSMSGISFELSEPLPVNAKVLLRIKNRTIDEHVDTSAFVLRSKGSDDEGWTIVCRFSRNLKFEQIHIVGRSLFAATIV